jgi:hypothetical protein
MKVGYLPLALVSAPFFSVCAQGQRLGHTHVFSVVTHAAPGKDGTMANPDEEYGVVSEAKETKTYKRLIWSVEVDEAAIYGTHVKERIAASSGDTARILARASASPRCETMKVKWYSDQIKATETSYGMNLDMPIYLRENDELIAQYQSSHKYHNDSDCECDVIGTAIFLKNGKKSGDQLMFMGACYRSSYNFVGGTGKY